MGDIEDNKIEERKEKVRAFFAEKLKLDNKNLIYLGIYIALMLIIYFTFKDKFNSGKTFLFLIIPIISIILFLLKKTTLAILINLIAFSFILRIQNLQYLIDVTTNQYIPADPDAMAFMRYAKYIAENGSLMQVDMLRYFPYGFPGVQEFSFLANFIVYLHKFLDIFTNFSLELVDVIYPAIAFAIGLIFFFLLVKKLFNEKIALLSTAFLAFVPSYLFRTLTGISDKEALATIFMFAALYFFVLSWKTEKNIKTLIYGGISGILTAITNAIWGGGVFIFLMIGIFAIIEILLNKFSKKDFISYASWLFLSLIVLMTLFSSRYNLGTILLSSTTSMAVFALFFYIFLLLYNHLAKKHYLLFEKLKFINKLPPALVTLIIAFVIGSLFMLIVFGGTYFNGLVKQTINTLTIPFATDRWVRTVAENSQPYITDWIGNFGKYYLWFFILGSILLFNEMNNNFKNKLKLTIIYTIFILGFIFSRYSPNSIFNGTSALSIIIYLAAFLGLILIMFIPYLYEQYKNKEYLHEIKSLDKRYLFILIWFFIMIIAARGAVRLIFIFSPITAILASYFVFKLADLVKKFKNKIVSYGSILIIAVVSLLLLSNFAQTSLAQASSVGPTYNQQWQYMGQWIRDNTSENSVFAHWWDYGYLVQYNNRATISDGGNAGGYEVNYFTGRHVLTGQSEKEALEFLKSKNVTHLLIVSDEIGKYPAYSSIGSNVNYDRYSWISTFGLNEEQTQETRNGTSYVYTGGFPLDEDLVYNGKVYPRQSAGIGAVILPVEDVKNNNTVLGYNIKQPKAILVYSGQQLDLPLKCVYVNNQKYEFEEGLEGCFRVIPTISNNQVNPIGAGLYLSKRTYKSLFSELYLFNKESENFKTAYSDESQIPLAIYNGRLIGPYKVWEVNYPRNLKVPEEYYKRELPDSRVTVVNEGY